MLRAQAPAAPLHQLRRYRLLILAAAVLLAAFSLMLPARSAEAAVAINQCNGTDNVGGEAVACTVTIVNNLNVATGVASSTVTTQDCHGAAGAPPTCITTVSPSPTQLTTAVAQCNGSGSGAGGTVTCSVDITNNITGNITPTAATVNQCVGSGGDGGTQPTTVCDPLQSTTGATVTQCNGSGNGGGGTMRVRCTVPGSTQTAALPVSVNQCNGSGNGGGSLVICTVALVNRVVPASTGGTTTGGTTTSGTRTPRTSTATPTVPQLPRTGSDTWMLSATAVGLLGLGGLFMQAGRTRRTPLHLYR